MFDFIKDNERTCTVCGDAFEGREGSKFCGAGCRNKAYRAGTTRTDAIRDREYINDLNNEYCKGLYSLPREKRLGYMENVARLALEDDSGPLRRMLTQKPLIYFKGKRKPGGYERTFPQAMNMYLKASPYRMNIFEFLAECPEVPLGIDTEVPEDSGPGSDRRSDLGWDYSHLKPEDKLPAHDNTGDYVHPFYKDMYPGQWRDRRDPPEYSYYVVCHDTDQILFSGSYQEAVEYFIEARETFRETLTVSVLYIRQCNDSVSGKT